MVNSLTRRAFLGSTSSACGAVALLGAFGSSARGEAGSTAAKDGERVGAIPAGFPRQDLESVREIVSASHSRFDRVKELVTQRPALAKASWDWGFGDWESALGAASHMGRDDIAAILIEHGARPNVFTFAMFGHLDAVRGIVEAAPGVAQTPGPHGITLLQHARNRLRRDGVSDADRARVAAVAEYLESLGNADQTAADLALSEDEKKSYVGRYTFGPGSDDALEVALDDRGRLTIARGDGSPRGMHRVEPRGFAPAGAPAVRIRFDVVGDRVTTLTVHDPMPIVKAARV